MVLWRKRLRRFPSGMIGWLRSARAKQDA